MLGSFLPPSYANTSHSRKGDEYCTYIAINQQNGVVLINYSKMEQKSREQHHKEKIQKIKLKEIN
jgi:hypothetical protein